MIPNTRLMSSILFLSILAGIFFFTNIPFTTHAQDDPADSELSGGTLLDAFGWITTYWDDNELLLKFENLEPGTYELYELENPSRIVIDIPSLKAPSEDDEYLEAFDFSTLGLVNQLRAHYSLDYTRIVLETRFPIYWEIISPETADYLEIKCLIRFRQTFEEVNIDDGTTYIAKRYMTPSGQRFTHAVRCDQSVSSLRPRVVRASDVTARNLASVNTLVNGTRAAVGINGGYFAWPGVSVSMVIQDGALTAPPMLHRPAFMVLENNGMMLTYPVMRGSVTSSSGIRWNIDVINEIPGPGQTSLLTPGHPARLRNDLGDSFALFKNDQVECVNCEDVEDLAGMHLLWSRRRYPPLVMLSTGEPVEIEYNYVNTSVSPIRCAIQGGPFLIRNGRIDITTEENDIGRDIALGRSARTALGYDNRGVLYFVVVEGPNSERSIGATLSELAWTMYDLGCTWAMNLDGGSSTGMALGFTNTEIDLPDSQRQVATAVILIDETGRLQGDRFFF